MDDRIRDDGQGAGKGQARGQRELERLRALARLFDQAFRVPGTQWRFGIDALFGLVPGLGDIIGALVAVYALHVARRLRAPGSIQLHMLSNIAVDALVGTVPVIGDLFDFIYKAQTRNLALLETWLQSPDHTARRSRRSLVFVPLAILAVFALMTATGIWALYLLFRWIMG